MKLNLTQITAILRFFNEHMKDLKISDLGMQNTLKLNKFLKECHKLHNDCKETFDTHIKQEIQQLFLNNLVLNNLDIEGHLSRIFFSGLLFDDVKLDMYLTDNSGIFNPIMDQLMPIINKIKKDAEELGNAELYADFYIDELKLKAAIENADLSMDKIIGIAFLFDAADNRNLSSK